MSTATDTQPQPVLSARRRGVLAALALIPAIAPLGVAVGVALGALSSSPVVTWLSAPLILAGASQVVLFTQVDGGATFLSAALAAILLNGRFVIYGAALASRFGASQPGWFKAVGPHYIVDQTYAATLNDIADTDSDDDFRRYFMTAGTLLLIAWSTAVGIGIVLGPILPPQVPIEFVLPASFVALVAPTVARASEVTTVMFGGLAVLVAPSPSTALAVAALIGATTGVVTSRTP
jgi:predicted branched-subunit amino acid permease